MKHNWIKLTLRLREYKAEVWVREDQLKAFRDGEILLSGETDWRSVVENKNEIMSALLKVDGAAMPPRVPRPSLEHIAATAVFLTGLTNHTSPDSANYQSYKLCADWLHALATYDDGQDN